MADRRYRFQPRAAVAVVREVLRHPANEAAPQIALLRLAKAEVTARLLGRPVPVTLGRRSKILAHLHRGGSWRAAIANPPDYPEMIAWRSILREGELFIDVGANAGVYTLWALDCGATVVAVEPSHEMVLQLVENLELNGYDADVLEMALAQQAGRADLDGPDPLRLRLQLTDTDTDSGVRVGTLDEVLEGRRARGVKIDVEGHERLVMEGASTALGAQAVDFFQLEWNDCSTSALGEDRAPVAAILRMAGYVLCRPDGSGCLRDTDDLGFGPDLFAALPSALAQLNDPS